MSLPPGRASRDPAVLTEFGHLVETFAAGEILKQVSWSEEAVTAAYFRTQDGDDVQLGGGYPGRRATLITINPARQPLTPTC